VARLAIADKRKQLKLTQQQLAKEVGVCVPTVRNWEAGREGARMFEIVAKLCKALNCSPEDLVGGDDGQ